MATAPTELVEFQKAAARLPLHERPDLSSWLERFQAGADAIAA